MAVGPPSDRSKLGTLFSAQFTPHPKSQAAQSNLNDTPESRAREAQKDAQSRVRILQDQVSQAEKESEAQLDGLKDEYIRRTDAETDRNEAAIENQRQKHYQLMRDMQRQQQAELNRVRRDGERTLEQARTYYRDSIYNAARNGDQELAEIKSNLAREQDYMQRVANDETSTQEAEHLRRIQESMAAQDETYAQMKKAAADEYERLKGHTIEGTEKAKKHFQERYQQQLDRQGQVIRDMETRANRKLLETRVDTSQKLDAYSARQRDPFYKMVDIGASLSENSEEYILTAQIPEHERSKLAISVRGDQIVLTGSRRNEEKVDLEPGRSVSTSSYQTYSESFPLTWPVNSKLLTREFDGDTLIVRIPKKGAYASPGPHISAKPNKVHVERPMFPENLPVVKTEPLPDPEADPPAPSRRSLAGRTLG